MPRRLLSAVSFALFLALSAGGIASAFAESKPAESKPAESKPTESKPAESQKARELARNSLSRPDPAAVIASLEAGLSSLSSPVDRVFILKTLASFEERTGNPSAAFESYKKAASAGTARDDGSLLDAARCALAFNDPVSADALVRSVLQSSFDGATTLRARVYSAWIQLAAGNRPDALALIRSFAANPACAEYAPALLFTLWWSDGDAASRATLLSSWPRSFEAACVRGEATVGPSSFWYLMGRNAEGVASFARAGSTDLAEVLGATLSDSPEPPSAPIKGDALVKSDTTDTQVGTDASSETAKPADAGPWQQIGFFRNREYADELVERLRKRGFEPFIREVVRPSGTRYHTVLVPEDGAGTTGKRLKNEGFESYLVTE